MSLKGTASMLVFTDVAPENERRFNAWYNDEHIDDMVTRASFVRGRRFHSPGADLPYLAWYEGRSPASFGHRHYLDLIGDFTPWSREVLASFTKVHRYVYRNAFDRSRGIAGGVGLVRFPPPPEGEREALREALRRTLPLVDGLPYRLGSFLLESDVDATNAPAGIEGLPFTGVTGEEWLVGIQATDRAEADAALDDLVAQLPAVAGARAAYGFLYGFWRDWL